MDFSLLRLPLFISFLFSSAPLWASESFTDEKDRPFFSCKSETWMPNGGLDKIIFISSCSKIPFRFLSTPQKIAEKLCEKWADERNIGTHYQTLFFENGENCHEVIEEDFKFNLEINHFNKVQYLSSSDHKTGKTTAYLNQRRGEKAIINPDGSEQAQWIQSGDLTYCGFVRDDIGFYTNLGLLEVIQFTTQEKAIYEYTEEGIYKLYSPSENLRAPFLVFNYPDEGLASVQFFEMSRDERKELKSFKMNYKDWNDNVTPSECY